MPKIPTYDAPQVQTTNLPNVQQSDSNVNPAAGRLGSITANNGLPVTADGVLEEAAANSQQFTGTFTSADAKTVTVVNGIIVSAG